MTRIAVITDAHANLAALEAALEAIRGEGCDAVYHTGDAIAIGPYPAECVDLLQGMPGVGLLPGNHELYFTDGLPIPRPSWMSEGEVEHQLWTHARLGPRRRAALADLPLSFAREIEGVRVVFRHYALQPCARGFLPVLRDPTGPALDGAFGLPDADLVFCGHDHGRFDLRGRARYVNPGSLGCHSLAEARYCVAAFRGGGCTVEFRSVPYDDRELAAAFEARGVPERDFIRRAFFGGRLR